jgi:hypothetical protein
LVITLDGDGQNDPRDIPRLLRLLEERRLDVVSGWRQRRVEGLWLRVLPSRVANRLIAWVTCLPVHDSGCGLKVYRRAVLAGVQLPPGFHRFLPAILGVTADRFAELAVNDRARAHGASHYGLGRTFVVVRDLLSVPFLLWAPRAFEIAWGVAALIGTVVLLCEVGRAPTAAMLATGACTCIAAMIFWNLWRYGRAQRRGVFRVRQEITCAEPAQSRSA